jgi:KDO2-lipid IV(A) lauroyltransferase
MFGLRRFRRFRHVRRRIQYGAVYALVRAMIFLSHCVSRRTWLGHCGRLGGLVYYLAPSTRALTVRHLSLAFPERSPEDIRRLARKNFVMLATNAGEILRATRVRTLSDLDEIMITHGFENFEAARAKGRGVIFLTCHIGPFDLQVTNLALRGVALFVIGTRLKDQLLSSLLWKQRNALGAVAVERGKETFRLLKALKSGQSVGILIDQDTRVKSRFVEFFGRPASTPVGAALLAMKTGASVVPSYIHLAPDQLQHMHLFPEIETVSTGDEEADMITNTQRYTKFIEDRIREHPDQWVWLHQRWKTKPGEEMR